MKLHEILGQQHQPIVVSSSRMIDGLLEKFSNLAIVVTPRGVMAFPAQYDSGTETWTPSKAEIAQGGAEYVILTVADGRPEMWLDSDGPPKNLLQNRIFGDWVLARKPQLIHTHFAPLDQNINWGSRRHHHKKSGP